MACPNCGEYLGHCKCTQDEMTEAGRILRCRTVVELEHECKRLQAIVDKLPKTADGVPVVPGMILWIPLGITVFEPGHPQRPLMAGKWPADTFHRSEDDVWSLMVGPYHQPICECYSTREAAEAAESHNHVTKKERSDDKDDQDSGR